MLNKPGFVSARYRQPDRYQRIFEEWVAVFKIGGVEYHIQLICNRDNKEIARSVEILCQGVKCRNVLFSGIPSIKQAMEKLEQIVECGRQGGKG